MIACFNKMTKMFAKIAKSFVGLLTTITSLNTMTKMFAIIAKDFIGLAAMIVARRRRNIPVLRFEAK